MDRDTFIAMMISSLESQKQLPTSDNSQSDLDSHIYGNFKKKQVTVEEIFQKYTYDFPDYSNMLDDINIMYEDLRKIDLQDCVPYDSSWYFKFHPIFIENILNMIRKVDNSNANAIDSMDILNKNKNNKNTLTKERVIQLYKLIFFDMGLKQILSCNKAQLIYLLFTNEEIELSEIDKDKEMSWNAILGRYQERIISHLDISMFYESTEMKNSLSERADGAIVNNNENMCQIVIEYIQTLSKLLNFCNTNVIKDACNFSVESDICTLYQVIRSSNRHKSSFKVLDNEVDLVADVYSMMNEILLQCVIFLRDVFCGCFTNRHLHRRSALIKVYLGQLGDILLQNALQMEYVKSASTSAEDANDDGEGFSTVASDNFHQQTIAFPNSWYCLYIILYSNIFKSALDGYSCNHRASGNTSGSDNSSRLTDEVFRPNYCRNPEDPDDLMLFELCTHVIDNDRVISMYCTICNHMWNYYQDICKNSTGNALSCCKTTGNDSDSSSNINNTHLDTLRRASNGMSDVVDYMMLLTKLQFICRKVLTVNNQSSKHMKITEDLTTSGELDGPDSGSGVDIQGQKLKRKLKKGSSIGLSIASKKILSLTVGRGTEGSSTATTSNSVALINKSWTTIYGCTNHTKCVPTGSEVSIIETKEHVSKFKLEPMSSSSLHMTIDYILQHIDACIHQHMTATNATTVANALSIVANETVDVGLKLIVDISVFVSQYGDADGSSRSGKVTDISSYILSSLMKEPNKQIIINLLGACSELVSKPLAAEDMSHDSTNSANASSSTHSSWVFNPHVQNCCGTMCVLSVLVANFFSHAQNIDSLVCQEMFDLCKGYISLYIMKSLSILEFREKCGRNHQDGWNHGDMFETKAFSKQPPLPAGLLYMFFMLSEDYTMPVAPASTTTKHCEYTVNNNRLFTSLLMIDVWSVDTKTDAADGSENTPAANQSVTSQITCYWLPWCSQLVKHCDSMLKQHALPLPNAKSSIDRSNNKASIRKVVSQHTDSQLTNKTTCTDDIILKSEKDLEFEEDVEAHRHSTVKYYQHLKIYLKKMKITLMETNRIANMKHINGTKHISDEGIESNVMPFNNKKDTNMKNENVPVYIFSSKVD